MRDETKGPRPPRVPVQRTPPESLSAFLAREGLAVLDVVPTAGAHGRRLLLGKPGSQLATHAVALADGERSTRLQTEQQVLGWLHVTLGPALSATVPQVVTAVQVDLSSGALVTTAVPGLCPPGNQGARANHRKPQLLLKAVDAWLEQLWAETGSGSRAPVEVGGQGMQWLLTRYPDSPRLASIHQAQHTLGSHAVPGAAVHGCLCPRHVKTDERGVIGVDDWGSASTQGDPLRDLGGFAVHLTEGRLAEALTGRTSFARAVRGFVTAGLERTGLPGRLWRDLLLLAHLDRTGDAVMHDDPDAPALLTTLAQALPGGQRKKETRRR